MVVENKSSMGQLHWREAWYHREYSILKMIYRVIVNRETEEQ